MVLWGFSWLCVWDSSTGGAPGIEPGSAVCTLTSGLRLQPWNCLSIKSQEWKGDLAQRAEHRLYMQEPQVRSLAPHGLLSSVPGVAPITSLFHPKTEQNKQQNKIKSQKKSSQLCGPLMSIVEVYPCGWSVSGK